MQQLINIVENLLLEHDCVIIPGFGGFLLQRQSAQLRNGALLPPRIVVGFNRQLTHDDGLLVSLYARQYALTWQQAKTEVARKVKRMQQCLCDSGHLSLGRLGEMYLNGDILSFSPAAALFLPQNLGLVTLYPEKRQEEPVVTIRLRRRTLHYAAACALGFCLLAFPPKSGDDGFEQYAAINPVNYTAILTERQAAIEAEQARQAEEAARIERRKQCRFHIVVASLDKQAAHQYAARLQNEGYNDAFVLPYKLNQYRVILSSYSSKNTALRQMQQLRQQPAYRRAWVYCEH